MKPSPLSDQEIEQFIKTTFEDNFKRLQYESGHTLSPDVKQAALNQIIQYWRKLKDVASRITDTEVHLLLPNQMTPKKRRFNIEGVVDIVREAERTTMYDLKTHDPEYVRQNISLYEQQLNVYAYIWQKLRNQDLDQTAVIATQFPERLKLAFDSKNQVSIDEELASWDPIIPTTFDNLKLTDTVRDFGRVVDQIEDNEYPPPDIAHLKEANSSGSPFAVRVCSNCDARFSCSSYREYVKVRGKKKSKAFEQFMAEGPTPEELEEWRELTLAED